MCVMLHYVCCVCSSDLSVVQREHGAAFGAVLLELAQPTSILIMLLTISLHHNCRFDSSVV